MSKEKTNSRILFSKSRWAFSRKYMIVKAFSLKKKESHGGISSIDIKGSTKMAYVIIN